MLRSMFIGAMLAGLCGSAALAAAHAPPATQPAQASGVGIDGKAYSPLNVAGHKAAVLIFVLQDCPICNAYAPQIEKLAAKSGSEGVAFYLIHVDPNISLAEARQHAKDYGYTMPILIDRKHLLVQKLGVVAVPTAVVLGPAGAMQYRGRIDNWYFDLGQSRNAATTHELLDALNAVLAGKTPNPARTRSIGCAVPDLPGK